MKHNKFLMFVGGSALLMLLVMLRGWLLTVLWRWFVVPALGLAPLTIPVAIGFMILLIVAREISQKSEEDKDSFVEQVCKSAVTLLLYLGIGYVVHLFV